MNQKKDNSIKFVKWALIALIGLVFVCKCDSIINSTRGLIKHSNSKIDTVIVHTRDTIWAKDTVYSFKNIRIPVPKIVYRDTVINGKDSCTNIKVYKDSLVDKNISIYYTDYVSQGELFGKDLDYKLKVPLTIIDSKTVTITDSITTFKQPKYSFGVGASVGTQLLCPQANVTIDRHTFGFGYNLQTKTPTIHYNFRLWSSKKR